MEDKKAKEKLLEERWKGQEKRIQKIIESAKKEGEDWTVHLEGLPYLNEIKSIEGEKYGRDLRGIDLRKAYLQGAKLHWANLRHADLRGADLWKTDLRKADLHVADFSEADLSEADLRGADLRDANMADAEVTGIKFNRNGRYRAIRVATCYGSQKFRRFAQHQDLIGELREKWWGELIYWPWLIFADCGRSMSVWIGWSIFMVFFFAGAYRFLLPAESFISDHIPWSFWTALYYSVVTFTTLGFGDVKPLNLPAAFWVMAEVILGYIMLGGLISIFTTKLVPRG